MTQLALNPFKKGKKIEVEGVRKVEAEGTGLEKALEQYESIDGEYYDEIDKNICDLKEIILSPGRINNFLEYVINEHKIEGSKIVGKYITKLIQDSYNAGNNGFVLDTHDIDIFGIGSNILGKEDNFVNITIFGNAGSWCGWESKYSNFIIKENAGNSLGHSSRDSNFTIDGNVEGACGWEADNSNFVIRGNAMDGCGGYAIDSKFTIIGSSGNNAFGSKRSTFIIDYIIGDPSFGLNSEGSFYKTQNKETYEKMLRKIPKSNTIQLLGPNGEVLRSVKK